ncbi:MAG: dTDP-4-dehydrorhamnose reductase [Bdellovibrionales bacterium]
MTHISTQDRIMLLGAGGQVGQTFRYVLERMNPQPSWHIGYYTRHDLDLTNVAALRHEVQTFAPDLIINCAAMSSPDKAEVNEPAATAINFHAVANLAALASAQDTPLIHLSTDFVFDGRQETPFTTEDQMNPLNVYGATKMLGEESLRHTMPWHVILRTSAVFGPFGNNMLPRTIKMLNEQKELHMVTDRVNGPTPALDLAQTLINIATQLLKGKADGYGTFHYCGTPSCSRYELTQSIMQAYAPFTDLRPPIHKTLSQDFPTHVVRPTYSVLDCSKIKRIYDIDQPSWQNGLQDAMHILYSHTTTANI